MSLLEVDQKKKSLLENKERKMLEAAVDRSLCGKFWKKKLKA